MTSLADNAKLSADEERFLRGLGQQLRADSIRCSTAAGPEPASTSTAVTNRFTCPKNLPRPGSCSM